ncbi:MAG TPA: hypothetical protein PLA88_08650 [Bacteroidales bacterium]|nr:hypothetical protein [Bacteroidales bacterium]
MKKTLKVLTASLLFFTAINALVAGALFIADPSGKLMGMTTAYLKDAPFSSFLIPGIVLFVVNGVLNISAGILTIRNHSAAARFVMLQGILLCGWIVVQILMVRDINALHIIMFTIGSLLVLLGIVQNRKTIR